MASECAEVEEAIEGSESAESNREAVSEAELALMAPQRFSVRDERSADWLVRKVVEADAHIRRVKQQSEREIARTQRERNFLLMRFGPELERWTQKQLAQHKGRRKSVLLLSGTVGFRRVGEKLVVDDENLTLRWASRQCKCAVAVVQKLVKSALNEHFEKTGDLPDGAHVEPAKDKFYIK